MPTRKGSAEELPFPDGSVDLLAASSAAHWFDQARFLGEASRVLKAGGCIALVDYALASSRLEYQDCGDRLTHIFKEVDDNETLIYINIHTCECECKGMRVCVCVGVSSRQRRPSRHTPAVQ